MDVIRILTVTTTWLLVSVVKLIIWFGRVSWRALRWLLRRRSTTFGSARWGTWRDARKAGILSHKGLIIGRKWGRFLRYRGDGGLLVIAPQGAGKGVSVVIPTLLDAPGSVFCLDVKGENSAITRRDRERRGAVYEIDAIHPETSHRFNPLSLIRRECLADDCAMLADLVVTPSGGDTHWDDSARNFIANVIAHVITSLPRELHSLAHVASIVAADRGTLVATLEAMARSTITSVAYEGRTNLASVNAAGDVTDELTSVTRNAAKFLKIWSIDRAAGMITEASDFDMLDLHHQTITIFVKVPEDRLATYQSFLRVMTGCAIIAMVRAKELPRPEHKPLLLFDECASLGRLDVLERGMGWLREYCSTISVWQSLGQLKGHYGAEGARVFLGAAGVKILMGINDNDTAHDLATAIGMTTVSTTNTGQSQASGDLLRHQQQTGASEGQRYLIDPAELQRLDPDTTLIIPRGAPVFRTRKIRYFMERAFKGRFDSWRANGPAGGLDLDALAGWRAEAGVALEAAVPAVRESETFPQSPDRGPGGATPRTAYVASPSASA